MGTVKDTYGDINMQWEINDDTPRYAYRLHFQDMNMADTSESYIVNVPSESKDLNFELFISDDNTYKNISNKYIQIHTDTSKDTLQRHRRIHEASWQWNKIKIMRHWRTFQANSSPKALIIL